MTNRIPLIGLLLFTLASNSFAITDCTFNYPGKSNAFLDIAIQTMRENGWSLNQNSKNTLEIDDQAISHSRAEYWAFAPYYVFARPDRNTILHQSLKLTVNDTDGIVVSSNEHNYKWFANCSYEQGELVQCQGRTYSGYSRALRRASMELVCPTQIQR